VRDRCRHIAAVTRGHCGDESSADRSDRRARDCAENGFEVTEPRHHRLDGSGNCFLVLVRHAAIRVQALSRITTEEAPTLFVIIGHDAPDAKDKRPQHRPAHLQHLEPLSQAGRVVLAGPFTDGSGSLIVVDLPSRAAVWEVVARDPYVINGIFNRVEVKPFMQVFPSLVDDKR
jgi:uncharacterized protein YciI